MRASEERAGEPHPKSWELRRSRVEPSGGRLRDVPDPFTEEVPETIPIATKLRIEERKLEAG
jgi:hypothetical protein